MQAAEDPAKSKPIIMGYQARCRYVIKTAKASV